MSEIRLPFHFAKANQVYVQSVTQEQVNIVHGEQFSAAAFLELQRYYRRPIQRQALCQEDFQRGLVGAYEQGEAQAEEAVLGMQESADFNALMTELPPVEDLLETEDGAPVVKLLNVLLSRAIRQKASDIHIETFVDRVSVRFRMDGYLQSVLDLPAVLAPLLISRLKIMAKLDIAEKRLPQDGRLSLTIAAHHIDVRLSTIPAHYGERVVLRLLDKDSIPLDLSALGMQADSLKGLRGFIQQAHGMILVTGPTGSGKTTTLYAALTELNDSSRNILTIEDPIEYDLSGIGQMQVNPRLNMTFARGLRALLRQDPDIVMVGEIRDLETAQMAVQASLTGHLVLSTLHTNSALGAVTRLRDMGIEPFLLSSTLIGVVAQRLVRLLCSHCKRACEADQHLKIKHFQPTGCEQCHHSGYQGRTGIYEVVSVDDGLRQRIHAGATEMQLESYVRLQVPSMRDNGWQLVKQGRTSVAEVLRVTREEP